MALISLQFYLLFFPREPCSYWKHLWLRVAFQQVDVSFFIAQDSQIVTELLIQEQAKKGDWDYKLDPVYTVGILDFLFDDHKSENELLHMVELKNQRCEVFYDKLKFIYIELPKFKKTEKQLENHFDKWLYVFRHLSELQNRPKKLQDKIFKKLFEAAEIAKFTPEEREGFDNILKAGWIDTFREFEKGGGHYSWWSYRANARARNIGWRIDYFCISKGLKPRLKKSWILSEVMGSDHCPIGMVLE